MEVKKGKGGGFVQRFVVRTSPLRRSGVDHTVLPANNTTPAFTRSSPEILWSCDAEQQDTESEVFLRLLR